LPASRRASAIASTQYSECAECSVPHPHHSLSRVSQQNNSQQHSQQPAVPGISQEGASEMQIAERDGRWRPTQRVTHERKTRFEHPPQRQIGDGSCVTYRARTEARRSPRATSRRRVLPASQPHARAAASPHRCLSPKSLANLNTVNSNSKPMCRREKVCQWSSGQQRCYSHSCDVCAQRRSELE
jgi:hypothetical protein